METNGNIPLASGASATTSQTRSSDEELSEYTDADESVSSAPTEFLAEFLSAVMLKDYETALKYCKLILQYEPNNAAAKEFYPLIVEKLHLMAEAEKSDNDSTGDDDEDDDDEEEEDEEEGGSSSSSSNPSADSDATTASYSSLEDDEPENKTKLDNADVGNGNLTSSLITSSDSESPTEPISQQLISQLRGKAVPKPT